MSAPHRLPEVVSITAPEGWQGAALTLDSGEVLTVSRDTMPAAYILPCNVTGRPLLISSWKDSEAPAYFMTEEVEAVLEAFFCWPEAAKKKAHSFKADPARFATVQSVQVLPKGAARLTLEDGQTLEVPDAAQSFVSPEDYTPAYLALEGEGEAPTVFYTVPEDLRLSVLSALGYTPDPCQLPAVIQRAKLEEEGRAVLHLRLSRGQPFAYRLPVPVPYVLSGRHSEAKAGQPYRLTLNPDGPQPLTLLCPFAVWPSVMPLVSEGKEADLDTKARAYLASLPTLEEAKDTGRAVILTGRTAGGQPVTLEVLRPFWVSVSHYLLDTPTPYDLTFWQGPKGAARAL